MLDDIDSETAWVDERYRRVVYTAPKLGAQLRNIYGPPELIPTPDPAHRKLSFPRYQPPWEKKP